MVVAHHCGQYTENLFRSSDTGHRFYLGEFLDLANGKFGVDLFFVISGFIMMVATEPLVRREPLPFLIRRFKRIYPMWWICSLAALALLPIPLATLNIHDWQSVSKSFLLLPEFDPSGKLRPILIGQGWTLIYELFFYLVFALFVSRARTSKLWGCSIAIFSLWAVAQFAPTKTAPIELLSNPILFEFVIGMWIGHLFLDGALKRKKRLSWGVATGLVLASSTLFLGLTPPGPATSIIAALAASAAVLLAAQYPSATNGPQARWLQYLGAASYSIYLTHTLVFTASARIRQNVPAIQSLSPDLFFALHILVAVGLGCLAYALIENPLHKWKRSPSGSNRSESCSKSEPDASTPLTRHSS